MDFSRVCNNIPVIFVGLSFYPGGAFLSYIFYSFNLTLTQVHRNYIMFSMAPIWCFLGATISALILFISKFLAKRIMWLHSYVIAGGSLMILIGGTLLLTNQDHSTACLLGGLGHGMVYIAGMAYMFLRSGNPKTRIAKIALCHIVLATGMVSSVHFMSYYWFLPHLYHFFGYFLVYSTATTLGCFLINELLHGLGLYNYKMSLDSELQEASEKRDGMESALIDTSERRNQARGFGLLMMAVLSKGLNGFFYNNVFLFLALISQSTLFRAPEFIIQYCILGGVIFGLTIALSVRLKVVYSASLCSVIVTILVAATLWETLNLQAAGVVFWVFYVVGAVGLFIPDTMIMEMVPPPTLEIGLFIGFVVEQIPIMISLNSVHAPLFRVLWDNVALWVNVGLYVALAIVIVVLMILYYPDTFQKPILQIQYLVSYNVERPQRPINPPNLEVHFPQPIVPAPPIGIQAPVQPGVFSMQPVYPGHQPVYMIPQGQPGHPGGIVTTSVGFAQEVPTKGE